MQNEHTVTESTTGEGGRLKRIVMPADHYSRYEHEIMPLLNFVKSHPGNTAHQLKKKLKEKGDEEWSKRRVLYTDPETGRDIPMVHIPWMLRYMELDGRVILDGNKWYPA